MAERLLRAQSDSVANHITDRSISDRRALTWLATETGWARSKRSAICSGKLISVPIDTTWTGGTVSRIYMYMSVVIRVHVQSRARHSARWLYWLRTELGQRQWSSTSRQIWSSSTALCTAAVYATSSVKSFSRKITSSPSIRTSAAGHRSTANS